MPKTVLSGNHMRKIMPKFGSAVKNKNTLSEFPINAFLCKAIPIIFIVGGDARYNIGLVKSKRS